MATEHARRLPFGAELLDGGGAHFRVWAPRRRRVEVVLDGGPARALEPEAGGWFAGVVPEAVAGTRYRFRLDGGPMLVPDPASRFQPEGPHGPSEIIDPSAFVWSDAAWPGLRRRGQVIYELHLGTFTRAGTWAAAAERLPDLVDVGVTCVEVMPIADFPGRFGWGYDGVNLYAPCRLYGRPDDARRFVDRAHALGLGVILDVVYNHLGPDGNYLGELSDQFVSTRHSSEWGDALNFDGEGSGPVRELFAANAAYWIAEYHFDGLRLDAIQAIVDDSTEHLVALATRRARAAAGARSVFVVAENDAQDPRVARPAAEGGDGVDAVWNDDFHHSARVAATGRREGYYSDFRGAPQELVSALKRGYLYQGQRYAFQRRRRGGPTDGLEPEQFVLYLENHDQVANSGRGRRLHQLTSPGRFRALTALFLLAPGTPMLFQGQEFCASAPFLYFADHAGDLAAAVQAGRARSLEIFASLAVPEGQAMLHAPNDPVAHNRCVLDWSERGQNGWAVELHRDLLSLRRAEAAVRDARAGSIDGAVLGAAALCVRFFGAEDRLLIVNLGAELRLGSLAEPLLAPPAARRWRTLWSSDDPRYGGEGTPPLDDDERGWLLPGEHAALLGGT
jgi:maltooligosyltrehalose trehalohydrolase